MTAEPDALAWTLVRCAVCGADRPVPLLEDTVRRGLRAYAFRIVRCDDCGFVYVSPRATGPAFDNVLGGAARGDAAVSNEPIYRGGLDHLRRAGLPDGGSILDLGCARGDFLSFAAARHYEVRGVDLNPALADAARERGFTVTTADLRDLTIEPPVDAVTLWDVIEHVDDPVAVLAACREAVVPGGLVFFHTGNAAFQIPKARVLQSLRPGGGPYLIPYQHISHFDPHTADLALTVAGLEPVDTFFAGSLHYRDPWKRRAMGVANVLGTLPPHVGGPLLTNAMGVIGRRP